MPDTPTNPPSIPVATHATHHPAPLTLGFLTLLTDGSGVLGGYLLTNSWGRPLEFRLSTAVQPNRVQQILYGPTLTEYLHAELIGKTLIEKTSAPPSMDSRTARLPAMGEFAMTPTTRSITTNTAIHVSHGRGFERSLSASGARWYERSPTSSSTDITRRDAGP